MQKYFMIYAFFQHYKNFCFLILLFKTIFIFQKYNINRKFYKTQKNDFKIVTFEKQLE